MISALSLTAYKNYTSETIRFSPGLNFLVGKNGMGKTNLLDAIYYLCMAKSHSTPLDRDTVKFDCSFFRIEAQISLRDKHHVVCVKVKPGEVKDISVDGKTIDRLSAYIGFLPVIMLSPEDIVLIQGGSTTRRRFMDVVLCQSDRGYLEHLQRYNKLLAQRNALLRTEGFRADRNLLMTYTKSMSEAAVMIHDHRRTLTTSLLPDVVRFYHLLSMSEETPAFKYISHLEIENLESLALSSIEGDMQYGRTTIGVHRDDLELLLDERQVKRFGSQGQIKSLLIALHLAQAEYLKTHAGSAPLLLLDDIFDRLDEQRAQSLIQILTSDHTSQVFISDASPLRVQRLIAQAGCDAHVHEVLHGSIPKSGQNPGKSRNANL